jgi:hypothetical protein
VGDDGPGRPDAQNCNVGKDPCTLGKKAKLTWATIQPADMERYRQIIDGAVLPNFATRPGTAFSSFCWFRPR